MTPSPDLNRQAVSGESSDEEENYTANIDTVSENITVSTTTIVNAIESAPMTISDSELEIQSEFANSSTPADDDFDTDTDSNADSDNGYETASEGDEPEDQNTPNLVNMQHDEIEDGELSDIFRQGFVFKCFAFLFIHLNSEEDTMFSLHTLLILPWFLWVVRHPLSSLTILYRCTSKRTAVVTIMCMTLLYYHTLAADKKLYLNCLILIKMHGILRRQELFPALLRLFGSEGTVWSTLWHFFGNLLLVMYCLDFSLILNLDDMSNQCGFTCIQNLKEGFDLGLYMVHSLGLLSLVLSVFSDGWHIYQYIKNPENQNFVDRIDFCFEYTMSRFSQSVSPQRFFYLTVLM